MNDDRDWSWLQRSAPAVPELVEHPLWRLRKRDHHVEARARATFAGPELRILIDGELWWSQVFQPATAQGLTAAAERKRHEFEAKGWELAP